VIAGYPSPKERGRPNGTVIEAVRMALDSDLRDMQKRLSDGLIQRAYRGVVSYMSRLRTVFADQRGERAVSGLYQGYFDMTYFALASDELKGRDLKLAVVFNYETFGFEVWLAGRNRKVQRQYWARFLDAGYAKHRLVEPAVGIDAIVMAVLAANYSLEDEGGLNARIVAGVMAFERDIVSFLLEADASKTP
jgi:hypothetical protein